MYLCTESGEKEAGILIEKYTDYCRRAIGYSDPPFILSAAASFDAATATRNKVKSNSIPRICCTNGRERISPRCQTMHKYIPSTLRKSRKYGKNRILHALKPVTPCSANITRKMFFEKQRQSREYKIKIFRKVRRKRKCRCGGDLLPSHRFLFGGFVFRVFPASFRRASGSAFGCAVFSFLRRVLFCSCVSFFLYLQ